MTDEEVAAKTQARLQKKLRVGDGEDILLTRRCSIFAFMPMYIIGFMILGIHLFFDWASAPDDATWYESVFFFLVEASGWLEWPWLCLRDVVFHGLTASSTIRPVVVG